MRLDRAERHTRRAGNLSVTHPFHVGQNDAEALRRTQLSQHPIEIDSVSDVPCRDFEGEIGSVFLNRFFEPSATPRMLKPHIDGHPLQPCAKSARVPQPSKRAPGRHECLLRQVVAERRVPTQAPEQPAHRPLSSPHQLFKRFVVSHAGEGHQHGLGRVPIPRTRQNALREAAVGFRG